VSKILIVEDDEDWIDLISNELKDKISHAVTKSILYKNQDYEFFISQINEIKPNLVIFDINMGNDPKSE
jgi:DNA-binding response OmpR family regulator